MTRYTDLQRAHARFIIWYITQLEFAAALAIIHQLRQGIRDTAGTHIVDKGNRVGFAHLPAAIDHFLTTALHFRVLTLHRGKIQIFCRLT